MATTELTLTVYGLYIVKAQQCSTLKRVFSV